MYASAPQHSSISASFTGATTSLTPSGAGSRTSVFNEATVESGNGGGAWFGQTGRTTVGSIGGGTASWSSSQAELQGLISVPTSPTHSTQVNK
jgi:hypothetical protein